MFRRKQSRSNAFAGLPDIQPFSTRAPIGSSDAGLLCVQRTEAHASQSPYRFSRAMAARRRALRRLFAFAGGVALVGFALVALSLVGIGGAR